MVNLAETFDLINTNPLGPVDGEENSLADKNITTLALEVPTSCLVANDPVIGAWTTASKGKDDKDKDDKGKGPHGPFTQVSRLGAPLVNEVVIGLKDKDRFNGSDPKDDAQFANYVLYPTLPALIEALFGVSAPVTPRQDLVQVFLTGVPGLNQPSLRPTVRNPSPEHDDPADRGGLAESAGRAWGRSGRVPQRTPPG